MVTRLIAPNRTDLPLEVELEASWGGYCEYWTVVLAFAIAKKADAVYYRLSDTDECLGFELGDRLLTLAPPPIEYRFELLDAIRRLTYGNKLKLALLRLVGRFARVRFSGQIVVEMERSAVVWQASALPDRIMLQRLREAS